MAETQATRASGASAVLDIGEDIGALIIYTRPALLGAEIEISPRENEAFRVHAAVHERQVGDRTIHAALFLALPEGAYRVWCNAPSADTVTVPGGAVAELDWRALDVALPAKEQSETHQAPRLTTIDPALLPPRYRDGRTVSSTPMGSAPMRYDAAGRVAWDEMWQGFCDLALAGGPPHRDTVLQPATLEEVLADPQGYERVVTEIERGLRLVTALSVERLPTPGWVGLRCYDERMASWLQMAIEVENVAVRCEGSLLLLPAGPAFVQEKEIKNVVTVVAKTHHYWIEHLTAR